MKYWISHILHNEVFGFLRTVYDTKEETPSAMFYVIEQKLRRPL